jgi:Integrase core domain
MALAVPSEKSAGPPWRSDGGGRDPFGDGPAGRGPVLDSPDNDKSRDKHIVAGKGSAFGRGFDSRLSLHQAREPVENAYVESFDGKFRDKCLNEHWFVDLDDVRTKIEAWRVDYNEVRPHGSLANATPKEYSSTPFG